jgi:hypothetical protein
LEYWYLPVGWWNPIKNHSLNSAMAASLQKMQITVETLIRLTNSDFETFDSAHKGNNDGTNCGETTRLRRRHKFCPSLAAIN